MSQKSVCEEISHEDLGGAKVHNYVSGVAHFFARTEQECYDQMRRLLSFVPSSNKEKPPFKYNGDPADRTWANLRPDPMPPVGGNVYQLAYDRVNNVFIYVTTEKQSPGHTWVYRYRRAKP